MNKKQYLDQRANLLAQAKQFLDAGDLENFNKTKQEIENLDTQYEAQAQAQANYAALEGSAVVPPVLQDLSGMSAGGAGAPTPVQDPYATPEYMNAFRNFVCNRTPIPERFRNEASSTNSDDVGAVIPTVMMEEIIRGLEERGLIFQSLRHLNVAAGLEIPISDLKPVATWIGDGASEDQSLSADESVSFKYYGLECKISQSILTSIVTMKAFQKLFVELAVEAVFAAVEVGVFNGTGNKQMLGIFKDPRVTNIVEMSPEEFASFSSWKKKVFAKIKKRYGRGKFYMAEGTFQGYIDGMVDEVGQPVGRTNYGLDSAPTYGFGGKRVETTEDDVIPPYDTAADGEYVAAYVNLKDFVFNSNMQMTVVHWTDNDNNKKKTKVLLICDGKIADPNGVILVKKVAAA